MDHLGRLSGTGRVVVGGADIGSASYDIQVYQSVIHVPGTRDRLPGNKEARGRVEADSAILKKVNDANMAMLELKGGDTVEFFITGWMWPSRHADITITGPIPGF